MYDPLALAEQLGSYVLHIQIRNILVALGATYTARRGRIVYGLLDMLYESAPEDIAIAEGNILIAKRSAQNAQNVGEAIVNVADTQSQRQAGGEALVTENVGEAQAETVREAGEVRHHHGYDNRHDERPPRRS